MFLGCSQRIVSGVCVHKACGKWAIEVIQRHVVVLHLQFRIITTQHNTIQYDTIFALNRRRWLLKHKSSPINRSKIVSSEETIMTTSKRLADRKVERFEKNIKKRGTVPETATKKKDSYPVGPIVLGFFIFVVIGSSLFQIIRTATSGGMA
ncbi:hypothetical protein QVD17_01499 [Tagetes erecta]|nr:hypothetical protein QVD17_01499 [Tagetes erecta]